MTTQPVLKRLSGPVRGIRRGQLGVAPDNASSGKGPSSHKTTPRRRPRYSAVDRRRASDRSAQGPVLPDPPSDVEKFLYYGRQHLWFIWVRSIAAVAAAVSLLFFSSTTTQLWIFWVPLTIFAGYMVLTHYCTTQPRRISQSEHRSRTRSWAPATFPSVDVFLPSCGEDIAVLRNTYVNVAGMCYEGRVEILVLDDSDRAEVRDLADEFGFTYHVRPNRGYMKKAGNLKYGYEHSTGDLITIFDADFSPRTDFLTELVHYFEDDHIGIVQTPQYFDTSKDMSWLQRSAGAVQESFYRWAQVSRDRLGAPICVGTCAIYRRAGLDQSGGFAQIGHSEDVHTGVNLIKVGYRTVYIPIILAKGLCPDKLSSFISQQYRWCAGSMSLLADREFHNAPLTYRQRACFFTGFGYYITTGVGVYMLALPTIVMLWFLPDRIHVGNFVWVLPTFLLYPLITMIHTSGWSPTTLRCYTISSFSHATAIWHVLTGRAADWVPTGEVRRTSMTAKVTWGMMVWTIGCNTAMVVGLVHFALSGYSLIEASPVIFFALMNAYIWAPIATMVFRESRDNRRLQAARAADAAAIPAQRSLADVGDRIGAMAGAQ